MISKEMGDFNEKYSLRGRVFQSIRQDILKGNYAEGEFLNETTISKELGVSRTPVREAIRQLEYEGLLYTIPNKGTIVNGIHEEDLYDIYEIRTHIEGLATKRCTENCTDEQLKELHHILDLMEYYFSKEDIEHFLVQDELFHNMIYNISGSRTLKHILKDYHLYTERYRHISVVCAGRMKAVMQEHEEIYNAIKNKDAKAAQNAMQKHVKHAKHNILKNLRKEQDQDGK